MHSGFLLITKEGALANQRAVEPIVGEKIPTALPERVFDKDMAITFGGETVRLHRVGPGHARWRSAGEICTWVSVGHLLRDAARALTSLGAVEAKGALPHSLSRCWWLF